MVWYILFFVTSWNCYDSVVYLFFILLKLE